MKTPKPHFWAFRRGTSWAKSSGKVVDGVATFLSGLSSNDRATLEESALSMLTLVQHLDRGTERFDAGFEVVDIGAFKKGATERLTALRDQAVTYARRLALTTTNLDEKVLETCKKWGKTYLVERLHFGSVLKDVQNCDVVACGSGLRAILQAELLWTAGKEILNHVYGHGAADLWEGAVRVVVTNGPRKSVREALLTVHREWVNRLTVQPKRGYEPFDSQLAMGQFFQIQPVVLALADLVKNYQEKDSAQEEQERRARLRATPTDQRLLQEDLAEQDRAAVKAGGAPAVAPVPVSAAP